MTTVATVLAVIGTYLLAPQLFPRGSIDALAKVTVHLRERLLVRAATVRGRLLEPLRANRLETRIASTQRVTTIATIIAWVLFSMISWLIHGYSWLQLVVLVPLSFAGVYWLIIEPRGEDGVAKRIPRLLLYPLRFVSFPLVFIGTALLYAGWMIGIYVLIIFELLWLVVFLSAYLGLRGQLALVSRATREPPEKVVGVVGFVLIVLAGILTIVN